MHAVVVHVVAMRAAEVHVVFSPALYQLMFCCLRVHYGHLHWSGFPLPCFLQLPSGGRGLLWQTSCGLYVQLPGATAGLGFQQYGVLSWPAALAALALLLRHHGR
jgi:hypothetical protein